MAESSLSIGLPDLLAEVGFYLGLDEDSDNWSAALAARVDAIIQGGVRSFYYPMPTLDHRGRKRAHQWSFLNPVTTLTAIAPYATGTLTSVTVTVTLTDGVFPSWAATNGTLVVDSVEYTIASRDGDTQITLDTAPDTAFAADSYSLKHDGNYTLPDDYGGIGGTMTYGTGVGYRHIDQAGEGIVRRCRTADWVTGPPSMFAVRPTATTGASGQRFEMMLFPYPDDAYILSYRYNVLPSKLSTSFPYPYGGMAHAQTIIAACLANAEIMVNHERGPQWANFAARLEASIEVDLDANRTQSFGYNGNEEQGEELGRSAMRGLYYTTVEGAMP